MEARPTLRERAQGCAVGAVAGDALGMPLEFCPPRPLDALVRKMTPGRLPAGTFTDDTEMALALAGSLLMRRPLDATDLAQRFVDWYRTGPSDIGLHTGKVLARIAAGEPWEQVVEAVQLSLPGSAGNGSVMRCWPVALAYHNNLDQLLADSRLQSQVTHPHAECVTGSAFINATIYYLLHGEAPEEAVSRALDTAQVSGPVRAVIEGAPERKREQLENRGWVRHTLESAVWGLLTTFSFQEAVTQVVNLGRDADTAGTVVGALAGAAYGLEAIPAHWQDALQGEWPLRSARRWRLPDLLDLADRLLQYEPPLKPILV